MADDKYKKIFAKNLNHYLALHHKSQVDLIKDLNLSSSTLSNWCTGLKLPRMDKVQLLADYFGILKSDLLEEKRNNLIEASNMNLSQNEKQLVEIYGETVLDALNLYSQLDSGDQGEIRGEMKQMLKAKKYSIKKELKNA